MAREASDLKLAFGMEFYELYDRNGLARLDAAFIDCLRECAPGLAERVATVRAAPDGIDRKAESELMVEIAPELESFMATLFGITESLRELREAHLSQSDIFTVKRNFVQRRALRSAAAKAPAAIDGPALAHQLEARFGEPMSEAAYARHVTRWLLAESEHPVELDLAATYAAWATLSPQGKRQHRAGVLFKQPSKRDPMNLIEIERRTRGEISVWAALEHLRRERNGFQLTRSE